MTSNTNCFNQNSQVTDKIQLGQGMGTLCCWQGIGIEMLELAWRTECELNAREGACIRKWNRIELGEIPLAQC